MDNKLEWEIVADGTKFKCMSCEHEDDHWAERDDLQEVNGVPITEDGQRHSRAMYMMKPGSYTEDEICNMVNCPNCKSWFYFEK